jgi:hypothetical protein
VFGVIFLHISRPFFFFLKKKSTIKSVGSTYESYKFNGEFAHLLYKN